MENEKYSKKEIANNKQYRKELSLSVIAYMVVLFGSIYIAKPIPAGLIKSLIAMTPVIPGCFTLWAIIRHMNRFDEFMRVYLLEIIATAGGVTAFFSFTYGFAEGIGFPRLTGFVYYAIFMIAWLVILMLRKLKERSDA
ncbi:MAG: hypothetical protein E6Q34_08095 [Burkholderiaceae bacterium]|nr:MAG: hypothetical protein E6Q34_08095 [Burkholderiaceae bacterium]